MKKKYFGFFSLSIIFDKMPISAISASIVSQRHVADACSLYLLSFLLDSTIGLVIIYILLILVTCLSKRFEVWYTLPGQYDDGADAASGDVRRMLFPWSIQTFLFLLFSGKCLFGINF